MSGLHAMPERGEQLALSAWQVQTSHRLNPVVGVQDAVYLREHHQGDGGLMQHVMRMPASESAARVSELSVLQDAAYAKNLAVMVKILRAPHLAVQ